MYEMQKQNNQAVILEAFQAYLSDFDKRYYSPLHHVSRNECRRANYVQDLIDTMLGRKPSSPSEMPSESAVYNPDRKMMSVTLECLMYYRKALRNGARQRFSLSNSEQQTGMYSDRLSRQRLDNTFWALSKPYMASLTREQTSQAKRLEGHFSPMEVIQIVISHEDELGDSHTEEHILEDANEMNSGHYDTYLPHRHTSVKKKLQGAVRWLKHRKEADYHA